MRVGKLVAVVNMGKLTESGNHAMLRQRGLQKVKPTGGNFAFLAVPVLTMDQAAKGEMNAPRQSKSEGDRQRSPVEIKNVNEGHRAQPVLRFSGQVCS